MFNEWSTLLEVAKVKGVNEDDMQVRDERKIFQRNKIVITKATPCVELFALEEKTEYSTTFEKD